MLNKWHNCIAFPIIRKGIFFFILFCFLNYVGHILLLKGLRRYYGLNETDILCIGHSMSAMGIDKCLLEQLTGKRVSKYTMSGVGICERKFMLHQFEEMTDSFPHVVVYDVSARIFSSGLSQNAYTLFFPFLGVSSSIDKAIRKEASKMEFLRKKLFPLTRYDDLLVAEAIRGWRGDWQNHSFKQFSPSEFQKRLDSGQFWHITFEDNALSDMAKTLAWLNSHNCIVVLLCMPSVDMLNNAEPEKYNQAMEILHGYQKKYSNVRFYDLNGELSTDYSIFADPIHLNPQGQSVVTKKLAVILKQEMDK